MPRIDFLFLFLIHFPCNFIDLWGWLYGISAELTDSQRSVNFNNGLCAHIMYHIMYTVYLQWVNDRIHHRGSRLLSAKVIYGIYILQRLSSRSSPCPLSQCRWNARASRACSGYRIIIAIYILYRPESTWNAGQRTVIFGVFLASSWQLLNNCNKVHCYFL
jgi:hypothetical protein